MTIPRVTKLLYPPICFMNYQQSSGPASNSLPVLAINHLFRMPAFFSTIPEEGSEEKQYPPSQYVTDDDGLKWRLCAGAAVLNSKNQLLIGERIGKPDNLRIGTARHSQLLLLPMLVLLVGAPKMILYSCHHQSWRVTHLCVHHVQKLHLNYF